EGFGERDDPAAAVPLQQDTPFVRFGLDERGGRDGAGRAEGVRLVRRDEGGRVGGPRRVAGGLQAERSVERQRDLDGVVRVRVRRAVAPPDPQAAALPDVDLPRCVAFHVGLRKSRSAVKAAPPYGRPKQRGRRRNVCNASNAAAIARQSTKKPTIQSNAPALKPTAVERTVWRRKPVLTSIPLICVTIQNMLSLACEAVMAPAPMVRTRSAFPAGEARPSEAAIGAMSEAVVMMA